MRTKLCLSDVGDVGSGFFTFNELRQDFSTACCSFTSNSTAFTQSQLDFSELMFFRSFEVHFRCSGGSH